MSITKLLAAVQEARPSEVSGFLAAQPTLVEATVPAHPAEHDPAGTTLLHWAMPGDGRDLADEHVEVVRLLLEHDADPNAVGNGPNQGRCAAISLAAWGNHVPLIELLLEHGADPNGRSADRTPVRTAAEHNHVEAVIALIGAGAKHSLYELLLAGLEEKVVRLLDERPDSVTEFLDAGEPPLHAALQTAAGSKLVPLLLERGAIPDACDRLGRTALHKAIDLDRHGLVELLAAHTQLDIFAAAGLGMSGRVTELIAANPSCALASQADGTTPLFFAVLAGSADIAERLLDAGADPSPRSARYWACLTPLHLSIMRRDKPVFRLLLSKGADPNAFGQPDRYSPSPLHAAARWGGKSCVAALLQNGADPFAGGPVRGGGNCALSWVAYAGQIDILRILVEGGLDVSDPRCGGSLHLGAARGHSELVQLLLELGADPEVRDGDGKTPLERAVEQGKNEIAELLKAQRGH